MQALSSCGCSGAILGIPWWGCLDVRQKLWPHPLLLRKFVVFSMSHSKNETESISSQRLWGVKGLWGAMLNVVIAIMMMIYIVNPWLTGLFYIKYYISDHFHLTTSGSKYRHSGSKAVQTRKAAKCAKQPTNNTRCSTWLRDLVNVIIINILTLLASV